MVKRVLDFAMMVVAVWGSDFRKLREEEERILEVC